MPNWVSNMMILRPEDAEKMKAFLTKDDSERGEGIENLDFEKIIPMPETVYRGDSGFKADWHPKDMTLEEYRKKYPLGDWYKWSINNWGTKWNACHCSWNPPLEDEPYGVLTFDTAWSLPLPVLTALYDDKEVNYQLYFVEESHAFFGAMPFTEDTTYPLYMNDPEGEEHADEIFEMVTGETEYRWMEDEDAERLSFAITEIKRIMSAIVECKTPEEGTRNFLHVKEDYVDDIIRLTDALVKWQSSKDGNLGNIVRRLRDYVYPNGQPYEWKTVLLEPGTIAEYIARLRLREQIQKIRMLGLNTAVGLTMDRCNERLTDIIRYEQVQMLSPEYIIPENLTIDSVKGKRILFKHLLRSQGYEGLEYKIANLIRQAKRDVARNRDDVNKSLLNWGQYEDTNQIVINLIDTATALVELYDDIPNMETQEFLRLMDVYVRTNLFQLDDENVKEISELQLDALRAIKRRIGVIHFKNMVQTGLVDDRYMAIGALQIKTEKLGL